MSQRHDRASRIVPREAHLWRPGGRSAAPVHRLVWRECAAAASSDPTAPSWATAVELAIQVLCLEDQRRPNFFCGSAMLVHSAWDVGVVEKEYGFVHGKERLDRGAVVLSDTSVRNQEIETARQLFCLVQVIDDPGRQ